MERLISSKRSNNNDTKMSKNPAAKVYRDEDQLTRTEKTQESDLIVERKRP